MSWNKDKVVYKILGGYSKLTISGDIYLIHNPTPYIKYLAEELYEEMLDDYQRELMSDDELYDWLIQNEFWSNEKDDKIKDFRQNIEKLQVQLFDCHFRSAEKKEIRRLLKFTRERIKELVDERHKFDYLSAKGVATIAKNKYIIGLSVCDKFKKPLFNEFNFIDTPFPLLDRIIIEYNKQLISTQQFREISRTEPWRQYWTAKEGAASVFPNNAADLTDEQLTLISWTRLYDNVFQHPKCPGDAIIEDDDALDGFLIKDKQERDKDKEISLLDEVTDNPRIKNADEVFIMADTEEDAKRINTLNTESGKNIKRQREQYIEKVGKTGERDLPDVRQRLQMEINKSAINAAKTRIQNG